MSKVSTVLLLPEDKLDIQNVMAGSWVAVERLHGNYERIDGLVQGELLTYSPEHWSGPRKVGATKHGREAVRSATLSEGVVILLTRLRARGPEDEVSQEAALLIEDLSETILGMHQDAAGADI